MDKKYQDLAIFLVPGDMDFDHQFIENLSQGLKESLPGASLFLGKDNMSIDGFMSLSGTLHDMLKALVIKTEASDILLVTSHKYLIAPSLVQGMYEKHRTQKSAFTYTDGEDIILPNFRLELINSELLGSLLKDSKTSFLPDGTLNAFNHPNTNIYFWSIQDYRFYYETHFHDYFSYPKGINIEPTPYCNLNCIMCPYHSPNNRSVPKNLPKVMTSDMLENILSEATLWPEKPLIEFCFRGEPLLRKEISMLVGKTKNAGFCTSLVTNGTLLDRETSKKLIKCGLDTLVVSIDAPDKETYESIRLGSNFDHIINNIDMFLNEKEKEKKGPSLFIRYVRQPLNKNKEASFVNLWKDKADAIIAQYMYNVDQHEDGLMLSKDLGLPIRHPCHTLWNNLLVDVEGRVSQCTASFQIHNKDIMGRLPSQTVEEIWNSDRFNRSRSLLLDGQYPLVPLCKKCDGTTCTAMIKKKYLDGNAFVKDYFSLSVYQPHQN